MLTVREGVDHGEGRLPSLMAGPYVDACGQLLPTKKADADTTHQHQHQGELQL